MFFILSKIFSALFSPITWITIFFIAGIISKKKRKKCYVTGIVLLLFFSNPLLINWMMHSWEVKSIKISSIDTPYEAGIVLGGAMRYYNSEVERPIYGNGVDRIMQAVQLYKDGKIKKIVLSGGSGLMWRQFPKESDVIKKVLMSFAIPENDILCETISRNTYENAKETVKLLKEKNVAGKILLITSGYHMKRSLACFRKAGITTNPFSVDERSGKGIYTPDKIFIPEAENLDTWDVLIHEWVGYFSYWVAGYV